NHIVRLIAYGARRRIDTIAAQSDVRRLNFPQKLSLRPNSAGIDRHLGGTMVRGVQGILKRVVATTKDGYAFAPKVLSHDMRAGPDQNPQGRKRRRAAGLVARRRRASTQSAGAYASGKHYMAGPQWGVHPIAGHRKAVPCGLDIARGA